MSLYDDLGVPRDAGEGEIKRAYRKKAQRAHPDKGGSTVEFHKTSTALAVLTDPKRRERYDRTGETEDKKKSEIEKRLTDSLSRLMLDMVEDEELDLDIVDIRGTMIKTISTAGQLMRSKIKVARAKIARYEKAMRRFKRKTRGPNLFSDALQRRIHGCEEEIKDHEDNIAFNQVAIKFLDEFIYEAGSDIPEEFRAFFPNSFTPPQRKR